ncbi:hypothetical protein DPMN_030087 [Dreissena polymorpha]|uniref:Uncharacterized protein n=1 Tax=Dreissena polymorpha TaxID=45954 RepID=A0A9D4LYE3_DREPO|nr:hypothetical protein DPMN_030087 [Dreissena polymorpha]
MCSMPNGQVSVVDDTNERVKLLDQLFNVANHCDVSGTPCDICQVTSSEVAVTFGLCVQFISVINGQLMNGGKLQLQPIAVGIAHHQGSLYITSRTAL